MLDAKTSKWAGAAPVRAGDAKRGADVRCWGAAFLELMVGFEAGQPEHGKKVLVFANMKADVRWIHQVLLQPAARSSPPSPPTLPFLLLIDLAAALLRFMGAALTARP